MTHKKQLSKTKQPKQFAFNKEKYIILIVGLVVSLLGFLFMIGGKSTAPNVFNPKIFDFQRLTLAPILVLTGYGIILYSILKKPKTKQEIE